MDWLEGELESDGARLQEDTGGYLAYSKVHSCFQSRVTNNNYFLGHNY